MPGEPDPLTSPTAPSQSLRLLVAGAAATVVVGFVVGFALGGRSADGEGVAASGTSPSTTIAAPSTTEGSTTTSEPVSSTTTSSVTSTTRLATTTTTTIPTTTTVPTTTAVEPFPTLPSTVAPSTAPPTTFAPSRIVVSYATDGRGRLIIPRTGTANLVITNEGGLAQQWLVTGSGFTTVGSAQGSLGPGQTVTVTLLAPPGELPTDEIVGIVSVLGALNPTVAFVIPPA